MTERYSADSSEIGAIQDAIATERLTKVTDIFKLRTQAQELRGKTDLDNDVSAAVAVFILGPAAILHPTVMRAAVNGVRNMRAHWMDQRADRIYIAE